MAVHNPLYELSDDMTIEPVPARRSIAAVDDALLITPDGRKIVLSPGAYAVVEQVLAQLEKGKAVQVITFERELTTQQAADILNVSRQYLIRLLDRGEIPFTKTGTHRRLRLQDVLAYRRQRSEMRRKSLANLARASAEMGDY